MLAKMSSASFKLIFEASLLSTEIPFRRSSPIVYPKYDFIRFRDEQNRSLEAVETGKVIKIAIIFRVSE